MQVYSILEKYRKKDPFSIRCPMSRKFLVVVQIDELCNLRCDQQNTEENQEKFKSNFVSLPYIITTTPPNI